MFRFQGLVGSEEVDGGEGGRVSHEISSQLRVKDITLSIIYVIRNNRYVRDSTDELRR